MTGASTCYSGPFYDVLLSNHTHPTTFFCGVLYQKKKEKNGHFFFMIDIASSFSWRENFLIFSNVFFSEEKYEFSFVKKRRGRERGRERGGGKGQRVSLNHS